MFKFVIDKLALCIRFGGVIFFLIVGRLISSRRKLMFP